VSDRDLAVLAHARHELRTPLGHIIGYSEMLLEEVEEGGDHALAEPLRHLHQDARQLLTRLNDLLAAPPSGVAFPTLGPLLQQLIEPVDALATAAETVKRAVPPGASEDLQTDLDKIAAATAHLHDLITHGEFVAAPGSVRTAEETAGASRPAPPPAEPGVILVVDDNASNRELLVRRLSRQGHQVHMAADGREARKRAEIVENSTRRSM
jgi:hypothetical protein